MILKDFEIGKKFFGPAGFEWLCTDKGTRVITAIMLLPEKKDYWFKGPPYSVEEVVFDDKEMKLCYSDDISLINARLDSIEYSVHPNFLAEDFLKMMKGKDRTYPRRRLLKLDRVGTNGEIWHPYSARKQNEDWFVKIFEIFTREFSEMHEDEFVKLKISTEEDMVKRKCDLKS